MSGDLQAKRKSKNRSKKKSQIQELAKVEHFEESLLGFGADSEDTPPPASTSGKSKSRKILIVTNLFNCSPDADIGDDHFIVADVNDVVVDVNHVGASVDVDVVIDVVMDAVIDLEYNNLFVPFLLLL